MDKEIQMLRDFSIGSGTTHGHAAFTLQSCTCTHSPFLANAESKNLLGCYWAMPAHSSSIMMQGIGTTIILGKHVMIMCAPY